MSFNTVGLTTNLTFIGPTTNLNAWHPRPHTRFGRDTRTVHAVHPLGLEVVRYDRAGKWWLEWHAADDGPLAHPVRHRQQVTFTEAWVVARAIRDFGGRVYLGRVGGKRFDAKVGQ